MTDFRERYKRIGYDRTDVDVNRALRSQRRDEDRRDARNECYDLRRNLDTVSQDDSIDFESGHRDEDESKNETEIGVQKRLLQLEKWREERNRKKLLEKKKAKPVFKVGVVHHRVYSPPSIKSPAPVPHAKLCKTKEFSQTETAPKRVTRATEKRLALKAVTNKQKRINSKNKNFDNAEVGHQMNNIQSLPFAPTDHQFKAPKGVTALPMFGHKEKDFPDFKLNDSKNISVIESCNPIMFNQSGSVYAPSMNNGSFSMAKSSTKISSLRRSLLHKKMDKQDSNNFPEIDSMNNSSIESVVLKMSTDDQETLDDQENINCNGPRFSDATKYFIRRRSSRVLTPTEPNQSDDTAKNVVDIEKKDQLTTHTNSSRKSKRVSTIQKIDEEKMETNQDEEVNAMETSCSEEKKIVFNQSPQKSDFKNIKLSNLSSEKNETDILSTSESPQQKKVKTAKKKSVKNNLMKKNITENLNTEEIELEPHIMRRSTRNLRSKNNDKILNSSDKTENNEITGANNDIKLSNKRKSKASIGTSGAKNQTEESIEIGKSKIAKKKNLLDSTLSDNYQNSTRFTTEVIPNIPDQSLIKFSPRHSVRPQSKITDCSPIKKLPLVEVETPGSRVTYSLINLSPVRISLPPSEPVKESTSFEMKSNNSPIIDEKIKQNCSLNISLPKNTSDDRPPAYFSPYVVTSRGKSSIRKELQKKRLSQVGTPEEEERTAQYYKHLLNQETDRLTETCDSWQTTKESSSIPEDVQYQIQAAIGQTSLLLRKKFDRFRRLVLDCETGKGEMLVTCGDLQGFWEMMYREIEDCDNRFNKLEKMRSNNWVDEELEKLKEEEEKKRKVVKKPVAKKKPVASKPSSLRAHIMAARKKKLEEKGNSDIEMPPKDKEVQKKIPTPKISTPKIVRRTSTPKSSSKHNSLFRQAVENSRSPLISMKISKMCKTPVVQLDESIVYINSDRTPAKSILKSTRDETFVAAKSANKVIFKEDPMEVQEFDSEKGITEKSDDECESLKQPTERRLNFESDSFNMSVTENDQECENNKDATLKADKTSPILSLSPCKVDSKSFPEIVPAIKKSATTPVISMSPLNLDDSKGRRSSSKKNSLKVKKQITFKQNTSSETIRSTRSNTVPIRGTPKPKSKKSVNTNHETPNENEENNSQEFKNFPSIEASQTNKVEFYLNNEGIICQRIISSSENTPTSISSKLKEKNSHNKVIQSKTPKNSTNSAVKKSVKLQTPKLRLSTQKSSSKTPDESSHNLENMSKVNKRTPRMQNKNLEESDSLTPSSSRKMVKRSSLKKN